MRLEFEDERFLESIAEIKERYLKLVRKCEIYEAALEGPDEWAVPDIHSDEGQFHYIPYNLSDLADTILELAKILPEDPDFKHSRQPIRPVSFVEVGCGIGRNVNLMQRQQDVPITKAVGFDIVPEYIETARRIYGLDEDVFVQDAMTFDYGGFDLIFFYRPFSDDKLEVKFENHLIDSAKTGAVIIAMSNERFSKSRKVAEIGEAGTIYKKL